MARKAHFLEDRGVHELASPTFKEVCELALFPIEPGAYVVLAKGDFEPAVGSWDTAMFELRLDVVGPGERHGQVHVLRTTLGTDQTKFRLGTTNEPGPRTWSLMVQATVPYKPLGKPLDEAEFSPPPRVVLSARSSEFMDSRGRLSNVRICALPADDIAVTTLP
jgi:hypothetical protein